MQTRRIIPCLDLINGRVTKGVKFKDNVELGDPVELARRYLADGCDELVAYDVTASAERRPVDLAVMRRIAAVVTVPFTVGGGIATIDDIKRVMEIGADKVSVNSLAVKNPDFIAASAAAFGSHAIVLGMDPVAVADRTHFPSGYEITTRGFREHSGLDAVAWAQRAQELGVGEIVVNSVDADGTCAGFNLEITRLIADAVTIPVIASGGAGCAQHVLEAFTIGHADAAIVAGILHRQEISIAAIKAYLQA